MAATPALFRVKDVFVGTTVDRLRVHVDIELRVDDQERQTVDHQTVSNPLTLSVTQTSYRGKKNIDRNFDSGGVDLDNILRVVTPAPGYTLAEVREIARIGKRWHLNTMRAACAHMTLPEGKVGAELLDEGLVCEKSGYKYGHAWLTEVLPDDVTARIQELGRKGTSHPAED
ncbi:hypothetical protein ABZS76_32820 [Streptomyces sp. NPDC005562]|uniref:hypothetical protein n=1 Tax=Streptomyces sp. NPDC005562 TaxID=3154890 RepID=UPI0033B99B49